jgi:SNF2 family DNA or RNA helicase
MPQFKIGDSVIYTNSNEKGIIVEIMPSGRGRQLYKVNIDNIVRNCLESNLISDFDLNDPFKRIEQGIFNSYLDFSKLNTSFKIRNTSNNSISTLKASNTIFKAYQFKPLLKFLNSDNRRLLVADEVGLGKTIEAGHVMLELKARGELKNGLIVCPKSLREKWRIELKTKFNLDFKIYDSVKDFAHDLNERPNSLKAIINYEKLRMPNDKFKYTENEKDPNNLFSIITQKNIEFDFLLCDEAHRLRNSYTRLYKGALNFIKSCKSVLFLTATPIMISELNLFNILALLDPLKYSNYSTFQNQIAVNKPFIHALSLLNRNASFDEIYNYLINSEINIQFTSDSEYYIDYNKRYKLTELFQDVPLFSKILTDLKSIPDNFHSRVELQYNLSDLSEINKIFSRTRKVEITQDWSQPIREPKTILVDLAPEERKYFDQIINEYIEQNTSKNLTGDIVYDQGSALGLIQRKRQISSSVYGFLNENNSLDLGIDQYSEYNDAKFDELIKIIHEVCLINRKKLIVFAVFKKTLKYLGIRLHSKGIKSCIIHGDINNRVEIIQDFKDNAGLNVLLSSEVGSEGLDMQFCDVIVNYDLPWNPMVVEQRIGRIDRFGQKSQVINIYNFIVKDSIQEEIYTRLLDRIGIFKGCIGDLEAILDKELEESSNIKAKNLREYFSLLEKEFYCTKISKSVREKKIEQIQKAIIIEQRNLIEISEGLTDTLTNDLYFKNEILNIEKNLRYVTEYELARFLNLLFETHLSVCEFRLINKENLTYSIKLPRSSPKILINFLITYKPSGEEINELFQKFINEIIGDDYLVITFSQDYGYNNANILRINAYHPLIIAAENFFSLKSSSNETTFQFGLRKNDIPFIIQGYRNIVLSQYRLKIIKSLFKRKQEIEYNIPIIYDLDFNSIINNKDVSDAFLAAIQLNPVPISNHLVLKTEIINDMICSFTEIVSIRENEIISDFKMRLETSKIMQKQRLNEFYNNRINNQQRIIQNSVNVIEFSSNNIEVKNLKRILPVQRNLLEKIRIERDEALSGIDDAYIRSSAPELLSLSLISIV